MQKNRNFRVHWSFQIYLNKWYMRTYTHIHILVYKINHLTLPSVVVCLYQYYSLLKEKKKTENDTFRFRFVTIEFERCVFTVCYWHLYGKNKNTHAHPHTHLKWCICNAAFRHNKCEQITWVVNSQIPSSILLLTIHREREIERA